MGIFPVVDKAIWVLEDDKGCRFVYEQTLDHRYETRYFERIDEFSKELRACYEKGQEYLPKLIVADLMLSDGNFLTYLTDGEKEIFDIPFIIVSSVDDIDALRFCFKEGALDYLTKPFKKNELLVKIENVLSGSLRQQPQTSEGVNKSLNLDGVEVTSLTAKQKQLLNLFLASDDRSVSRNDILENVWQDTSVHPKTVDVHLYNLRRKVNEYGYIIRSDGGGRWSLLPERLDR
jgi:DNA-binding response OmpR family regulator